MPRSSANPLAVLIMLGTVDPRAMWEGGGNGLSAYETRDFWRALLGTDEIPTHDDVSDIDPSDDSSVEIDVYSNGAEGSAVAFYTVNGGGHRYPSIAHDDLLSPENFGPQNRDIEYTAEIWNFLRDHSLGTVAVPEPSGLILGVSALASLAVAARRHKRVRRRG